jgi:hypothetical protein
MATRRSPNYLRHGDKWKTVHMYPVSIRITSSSLWACINNKREEWIVTEINEWLQENHEDIKKAARIIREGGQEVGV